MQEGRLLSAGSPSALQCLVGHRKAVPAREASLKASKEGPAGRSAWPARQSGNAESCQLSHLVGSTVLEGKFAPLSASVVRSSRSCPSCLEDLVQKHRFTTHVKATLLEVSKYPPSDRDHAWQPFSRRRMVANLLVATILDCLFSPFVNPCPLVCSLLE